MQEVASPAPHTPPVVGGIESETPTAVRADMPRSKSQSRRTLGNWQLGKTIGQGSMGRVRLGYNLLTGEQVGQIYVAC